MKTFPMFLTMDGRRVVIAGGGEQAAQKCRLMLKTSARIHVLAPTLDPELTALHKSGRIDWLDGPVGPCDFADAAIVFIATGSPAADACLHALAKAGGALVNVVDQPRLCDAITPSIVDRDPVVVAIGTEGTAPVLARQIKTRVEQLLEPGLGDLAALAGRLRDLAAARLGPRQRRDLWRWVFAGPPRDMHATGAHRQAARAIKTAIATGSFGMEAGTHVSLVSAGPGPADLITLRAVRRLQEAEIIFHDDDIHPGIMELARRDAERASRRPGAPDFRKRKMALLDAVQKGKRIVVLRNDEKGSTATFETEMRLLRDCCVKFELVPPQWASTMQTPLDKLLRHRTGIASNLPTDR